jgi:tRNA (mo5U34)-methyltransferase
MFWWHTITFPNGVTTRGVKHEENLKVEAEHAFKYSVEGKSVLDVGAWNGNFSIEAVRRGARKVVSLDKVTWESSNFKGFQGFELARRWLAPEIESVHCDVNDLRTAEIGEFDCTLFLGVLYHLKHPLYVLESLAAITREHLVLETHLDLMDVPGPAMAYYPNAELCNDPSNWWGPNPACVTAMLKTAGFKTVEYVPSPFPGRYVDQVFDRGFFYAFK